MKKFLKKAEQYLQSRKRIICILAPALFGLLFMILCFVRIDQSLSLNEVRRVNLAKTEPSALVVEAFENNQSPLFIAVLKLWSHFFGYHDYSMRMLPIFLGAIAVLLVYLILKKGFGARIAIPAIVLLATSPILVFFGSRISPLTCALVVISLIILIAQAVFIKHAKTLRIAPVLICATIILVANIIGLVFVYNTKTANIRALSSTIAALDNHENLPIACDSGDLREVLAYYSTQSVRSVDSLEKQSSTWLVTTLKDGRPQTNPEREGWRITEYSTMNYDSSGDTYVIVKLEKE